MSSPLDLIHVYKEEDNNSVSCFIHLLQLWHLLRSRFCFVVVTYALICHIECRMELPVEKLLSPDVVHSFTNTLVVKVSYAFVSNTAFALAQLNCTRPARH